MFFKQIIFILGEGSNLTIGKATNAGAIVGTKRENSRLKINEYTGKDLYNTDKLTTTGGSGFNQDSRDKQGITRNTVVGDVEIAETEGSTINRDLRKGNEITKDTYSRTNINIEPQVIEYISNPAKFKEDLEVAILEGKATGETVLKSIENIVNGGKEDIGDPERRAINEIKEAVIRVKTAPQMESIAKAKDLNSPDVLKQLGIAAIEKFNPDNPDLPENVRARLDELAEDGKTIKAFYDKTTNKIFVNENIEDDVEIRASIAREWKISEDLKDGKGKSNEEGRLKATVAGELAYDDMMKRGREGKTGNISTVELNEAVMDVNSEVTSDKALEVKPEDLRAWGSAISQIDGPYPYADMISGVLNGVVWLMENDNRIKSKTKNSRKANEKAVKAAKKKYEEADKKYKEFKEKKNKTPKDKKNELYWKGQKAHWYKQMKELSEPHAINNVRH